LIFVARPTLFILLSLLAYAVLEVGATSGRCETAASSETFVITQKHTLQGTETVHVNAHALRIDSFSGVSIITTAPNWDIYICDFKRKTAYKTTTQAYENELFQTLEAFCEESPRKVAMEKIGERRLFLGAPSFNWRSTDGLEKEGRRLLQQGLVRGTYPAKIEIAALDRGISPAEAEIISKFYGVPVLQRFPLRSQVTGLDHRVRVELQSSAISTQQTPDSYFALPADCVLTSKDRFLSRVVNSTYRLLH
jgi:hypothetical protein